MTKKVIFVSDFFIEQGVTGGAEFYNDNLMKLLSSEYEFVKVQCTGLSADLINQYKEDFFIVANFMSLSEENKTLLQENVRYAILEHDHKY